MRVDFYSMLRPLTGCDSESFDLGDSATTRRLLAALVQRFPALRPFLLDDSGSLRSDLPIFVDGRNPRLLPGGLDASLRAECVVSLFSPVASGRMNVEGLRPHLAEGEEDQP